MFSKINFSKLFTVITVLLFGITLWFSLVFVSTKQEIIANFEHQNVNEVHQIAANIAHYINNVDKGAGLYAVLKADEPQRLMLESFLSTFQIKKIKNIFIVDKSENHSFLFRVLLDGGKEKDDKFYFAETFQPEHASWGRVLKEKEPTVLYQDKRVDSLWATFLYPIVQKNGEVAILALDFSKEHYLAMLSSLDDLALLIKGIVFFLFIVFVLILVLSVMDKKREEEKVAAQKALEELNITLESRVIEEVTKNREKDQQLIQQSRLASIGEMISMIAHQWRQPLSAISSTVQGLNLKISLNKYDAEQFVTKLDDVRRYVDHLSQTINDFRQFFKADKEKSEVTLETVVEKTLGIISISLEEQNIGLELELKSHLPVLTHPNELMQVALNLVKNAEDVLLDNTVKNAWIKIETYYDDTMLYLTVADNGGGVPLSVMSRIFDPYFSTKTKKDGTGLGLYMSKKIVEEHCNGVLSAENTPMGAKFTVALPRTDDEAEK